LFGSHQARDIVKIEQDLGHGFKFNLSDPPSIDAALKAAAKTSAIAVCAVPQKSAEYFREATAELPEHEENNDHSLVIARCLTAISRRSTSVQSRSWLT